MRDKKGRFTKGNKERLGKILSEESIEKIRQKNQGKHFSPSTEFKKGHIAHNKGMPNPQLTERNLTNNPAKKPEVRKKMKETRKILIANGKIDLTGIQFKKGRIPWNKGIKGYLTSWKGRHHSIKMKEKHSEIMKNYFDQHPEIKQKISIKNTGRKRTEDFKNRLSVRMTENNPMKDPILKEKATRNLLKIIHNKPNKAEFKLNEILQQNFPNEWKYVGNGEFILGGKNPDFLNCNGKKQVIELFGNWFHSKEFAERHNRKYESPEQRTEHYKKYGFNCLIIWESELKNEENIVQKVCAQ